MTLRSSRRLSRLAAASFIVLAAATADSPARPTPEAASSSSVTCAFSNPGYSGWCRQTVQVGAGKSARSACAPILACLNNVRCTKTYCDATTIRRGWKLAKVESAPAGR